MFDPKFAVIAAALVVLAGCGGQGYQEHSAASINAYPEDAATYAETEMDHSAPGDIPADDIATRFVAATGSQPENSASVQASLAALNRKIIYNTTIGLVVENYRTFESDMPALVATHGGFIASNDTQRRYNDNQSGTWVIRVPVTQYSAFLNGVHALGFAESRTENAQDVTEEFVDIQARINNKKKLESRIVSMLEDRTGKLSDVLEIERELSRVREDIERMEGRLRFLRDRTSLATVTIHCREQQHYEPAKTPTLGSRITLAWSDSIGAMRFAGENLLVAAIALMPWLVLMGSLLWVILRSTRRWWRPLLATTATPS